MTIALNAQSENVFLVKKQMELNTVTHKARGREETCLLKIASSWKNASNKVKKLWETNISTKCVFNTFS